MLAELEPERPTDSQVLDDSVTQRSHDTLPGHGRARSLSRSQSTFA